ncbi:MAG TPA: amidohydrolase family protein, partial [Mesorhizobium sp.]|nr:amidohydrolase family protein [Mesorhizobium sp.]
MADIQPNTRPLDGPPPRLRTKPGATDCHMHFYMPGFEAQPGGPPIAEYAMPEHYAVVQKRLGLERVVITQGNAYQFDNRSTLTALKQLGRTNARAIVTISPDTAAADIQAMSDLGACGARIMNLPGGATPIRDVKPVEAKIRGFGWHLMVQLNGREMDQYFDMIDGIETNYVLDHIAKFIDPVPADDPRVDSILRLIDKGNCWFKIAGAYETSLTGGPDFADVAAIAKRVIAHAPERILWGSNWPHV